jgi:hypothetical protein
MKRWGEQEERKGKRGVRVRVCVCGMCNAFAARSRASWRRWMGDNKHHSLPQHVSVRGGFFRATLSVVLPCSSCSSHHSSPPEENNNTDIGLSSTGNSSTSIQAKKDPLVV